MPREFSQDFDWQRNYLDHMREIAGRVLLTEASFEEDAKRNTDLIVLKMDAVRIGCRVRQHAYLERYGDEFTIRSRRTSGAKTELEKILEGWGDYLIYGFAHPTAARLCAWLVADLAVFRAWFVRRALGSPKGEVPGVLCDNHDGTFFRAFSLADLPSELVLARGTYPDSLEAAA